MALSPLIEKALSLRRAEGGALCSVASSQISIPFCPDRGNPDSIFRFDAAPLGSFHAAICYELVAGECYPNAFTVRLASRGLDVLDYRIPGGTLLAAPIPIWVEVTAAYPLYMTLTNEDNVAHPWSSLISYLLFSTSEDLANLYERLDLLPAPPRSSGWTPPILQPGGLP